MEVAPPPYQNKFLSLTPWWVSSLGEEENKYQDCRVKVNVKSKWLRTARDYLTGEF